MQNQIFEMPEVRKSALFLKGFQTGKRRWRDSRSPPPPPPPPQKKSFTHSSLVSPPPPHSKTCCAVPVRHLHIFDRFWNASFFTLHHCKQINKRKARLRSINCYYISYQPIFLPLPQFTILMETCLALEIRLKELFRSRVCYTNCFSCFFFGRIILFKFSCFLTFIKGTLRFTTPWSTRTTPNQNIIG